MSAEFESTLGAPQGDSLSGLLFNAVFAAALYHLRAVTSDFRPNPPISDQSLPMEWEYADDGDFIDTELANLHKLFPISKAILEQWNLLVNEEKTEYI